MEAINFEPQNDTPLIILDKEAGRFEFSGKSLPENVVVFYEPILAWLDEYKTDPNDFSEFVFKLEYFNTASSKMFYQILEKIKEVHNTGKDVKIIWYYPDDDDDMEEIGEEYSNVECPFELISFSLDGY